MEVLIILPSRNIANTENTISRHALTVHQGHIRLCCMQGPLSPDSWHEDAIDFPEYDRRPIN